MIMDIAMLSEMIARMTSTEREELFNHMEKRFPNLVDDIQNITAVVQREREVQMEMNI
tara:strand:- start:216 stop:389 length:174 start_codon:yes stop_codon:yes gene_type:complete